MKFFFLLFVCFISLPGFSQEDDEKVLGELEEQRRQQVEAAANLQPGIPTVSRLDNLNVMDEKGRELIKNLFNQSKISSLPPDAIKQMILSQVKGKWIEKVFATFPILLDISVDVVRDKNALPGLMDILGKKDELKLYAIIWVALLFAGWVLRKLFVSKERPWFINMAARLVVSTLVMSASLGAFYHLFKKEVSPTVSVITKHL